MVDVRAGYDRWAEVYDRDGNPLIALDERVVPRLLRTNELEGKRVLELACGTGRHTSRLVKAGARVTALDFSRGMLEKAKARAPEAVFVEGDLTKPLPFPDASFDLVLCCLALEHVRDLAAVFREVKRVLGSDGAFVASDMHPYMRLRGKQAKFDDPKDGTGVYVDGHLHPISEYVMAALDAGFRIERIEEHIVDEALAKEHPRAEKYVGWQMLVALRVTA